MELLGQNVGTVVILIDIAMLTFIALQFIPTPVINFFPLFQTSPTQYVIGLLDLCQSEWPKKKIVSQCSFNLYF